MMTAAFDDTVDILQVVHDKALMKEMTAAQVQSSRNSGIDVLRKSCHSSSETNGKSARSRQEIDSLKQLWAPIVANQTDIRLLCDTAAQFSAPPLGCSQ